MRRPPRIVWASLVAATLGAGTEGAAAGPAAAVQRIVSTEVSEGPQLAGLELTLVGGVERAVRLERGRVIVDGRRAGTYEPGGALEAAWRDLLAHLTATTPDFAAAEAAYRRLAATAVVGAEAEALAEIRNALDGVLWSAPTPPPGRTARPAPAQDTAPAAAGAVDTARQAPEADRRAERRRRPTRGGVIIEIESLGDVVNILDDIGLDRSSLLVERLERLRTPIKVVAFYSRYEVPAGDTLHSSLLLWDTRGRIAGVVRGDLVVIDGDARLLPGAVIEGDVVSVEGRVDLDEGEVRGSISMLEGSAVLRDLRAAERARAVADRMARSAGERMVRGLWRNVLHGVQGFFGTLGFYIFFALIGVFTVYFLSPRLETVADTASASFGRSLLVGLAAQAIFPVACVVLVVLILTIPVIPVYVLAMGLGTLFGYLGVAYAAGANFLRQPGVARRIRWDNAYARLLVGLGFLLGLFALAALMRIGGDILGVIFGLLLAAAILITWGAATAGLGAVILSRFGTRRDFARPPAAAPTAPTPAAAGSAAGGSGEGPTDAS